MAKVKFYKVNNSVLSSLPVSEGQLIFVQDTGKLYIDKDNSTRVQVDGINYTGSDGITITNKNITNSGVRAIETGATNGTISVNTNGTTTEVSVYGLGDLAFLDNISTSNITSGTLSVERGGTGADSFTSGQVLVGNGTSAFGTRAIDTTDGGTASSTSLITSGAVKAGLDTKLNTSLKGANSGLAELDATGKVPSSQLPSYVDDVLEYPSLTDFPSTGETGKIYVATDTNKTYRWSGSAYVVISETLALGETDSTAYRGDRGATAYSHATDSSRLTTATAAGLYKVGATAEGHISGLTASEKSDITGLGIPGSDTTYTFATGSTNGSISVTPAGGSASDISVKGLDAAAYKDVDTTIAAASTSTKLPTSEAVASFVEGKGYTTNIGTITKVQANGTDIASSGIANIPAATTSVYGVTELSSAVDSSSEALAATPKAVKTAYDLASGKIAASDVVITPVQASGATVGTIKVGDGSTITLYAPEPGNVSTELATTNQTYYLTGVKETTASSGSQIYNTRLSNTFTGLKYQTSTSAQGGTLTVDDREVTLGLYYTIA